MEKKYQSELKAIEQGLSVIDQIAASPFPTNQLPDRLINKLTALRPYLPNYLKKVFSETIIPATNGSAIKNSPTDIIWAETVFIKTQQSHLSNIYDYKIKSQLYSTLAIFSFLVLLFIPVANNPDQLIAQPIAQNQNNSINNLFRKIGIITTERDNAQLQLQQQRHENQILENQTGLELETRVEERTEELRNKNEEIIAQRDALEAHKAIIDATNKDMLDSLRYARRIQDATLVGRTETISHFKDAFILYEPKDIISGDFYWFAETEDCKIFAIADCTGHGVPGAVLTMLGNTLLNHIVLKDKISAPGKILTSLHQEMHDSFRKTAMSHEINEGMDISICTINKSTKQLYYSGAINPLYIARNNKISIIPADRVAIGSPQADNFTFSTTSIDYQPENTYYMFSDGYADQFGGPENKKFKRRTFRELLEKISHLPLSIQKEELKLRIRNWQGKLAQTDDIIVAGFKI